MQASPIKHLPTSCPITLIPGKHCHLASQIMARQAGASNSLSRTSSAHPSINAQLRNHDGLYQPKYALDTIFPKPRDWSSRRLQRCVKGGDEVSPSMDVCGGFPPYLGSKYHSDMTFPHHVSPDAALEHFGQDKWFMNHHIWDRNTTPHPISGRNRRRYRYLVPWPCKSRWTKD